MKKRWKRTMVIILVVMLLPFWSVAASDAYISNVSAEVDKEGVVTIGGYNSRGPGHEITVKVTAPDGILVYVDEVTSSTDGNFLFVNLLSGNKAGRYQVMIGADGALNAVRTYFDYYPDKTDGIMASVDVNASIDKSNKVTVSGTISAGDGQQLTILIKDPANKIELVDHCISRNDGKYEFSYVMKNTLKGRYRVAVGSSGLVSPVFTYLDYGMDANLKAKINKNKLVSITGNIGSGAGQQVNVKITDPANRVEYVGNAISRSGGDFSLEYTMKNSTTGRYYVTIGADGMSAVAETYFIYDPSNAELKSLSIQNVQLNPNFSPDTTKYSDVVNDHIRNTKVIPEANNEGQTITVNGIPVKSGEESDHIRLYTGMNTVRVKVTSADGTNSKTYVVDIERLPAPPSKPSSRPPSQPILSGNADLSDLVLSNATFEDPHEFTSSNTEYLVVMDPESTAITVTPTASDEGAQIAVNGMPVVSGSTSDPIEVGEEGVRVNIVVTAENGTTKEYVLTVICSEPLSGNADLSGLVLQDAIFEDPHEFSSLNTEYLVVMAVYGSNDLIVIPTASDEGALITVNGTPVASGSPSDPIEVGEEGVQVNIVVTAENGTTKEYILRVIRI